MKGVYLINPRWKPENQTALESIERQKNSIQSFIEKENILIVKLNPSQLNDYYTIPHALLYDLKQRRTTLDCLVVYSEEVMENFIYTYPARWIILKSFFEKVMFAEKQGASYLEGTG